MEHFVLENPFLRVTVGALGAELLSLRGPDGQEQMWKGDPEIWARRGPVIFPILGGWPEDCYQHKGKTYRMDKNGFARSAVFTPVAVHRDRVELELRWDRNSWEQYPFAFRLNICYDLNGKQLKIFQSVVNESTEDMPAALGLHPGFSWDRSAAGAYIRFSSPQKLQSFHPDGKRYCFPDDERQIMLTDALFSRGAISMEHPDAKWVELCRPEQKSNVRLYLDEYGYLTLWTPDRPDANFLCIEPSTSVGTDGNRLEDRRGICMVKPGCAMRRSMMIELIPSEGVEANG